MQLNYILPDTLSYSYSYHRRYTNSDDDTDEGTSNEFIEKQAVEVGFEIKSEIMVCFFMFPKEAEKMFYYLTLSD